METKSTNSSTATQVTEKKETKKKVIAMVGYTAVESLKKLAKREVMELTVTANEDLKTELAEKKKIGNATITLKPDPFSTQLVKLRGTAEPVKDDQVKVTVSKLLAIRNI
ncbi:hypothetical protein V6R21_07750 [Limibacter armeniacum]|uniref:hypothetical protein n=1 Tax=Limibacter armeniacum TaxID=466084 RepID=UPI002FE60555